MLSCLFPSAFLFLPLRLSLCFSSMSYSFFSSPSPSVWIFTSASFSISLSLSVNCPWWGNDGTYVDNCSFLFSHLDWIYGRARTHTYKCGCIFGWYTPKQTKQSGLHVCACTSGVWVYYVEFVANYNQCLINVPHWNTFIFLSQYFSFFCASHLFLFLQLCPI